MDAPIPTAPAAAATPTDSATAPAGAADGGAPAPPADHLSLVRSAVLAHCGRLAGAGHAMDARSITAVRIGVGLGYLSTVYAATFTATPTGPPSPPPAGQPPAGAPAGRRRPHTVIVKVAPSRAASPDMLDLRFHATEVAFLTRLAPAVGSPLLPATYGAAVDAATDAGVVVMEDLRRRGGRVLP